MNDDTPGRSREFSPRSREFTPGDVHLGRLERRQARIREQLRRDQTGSHKVQTWAYAVILAVVVGGWLFLIITSR